MKLMKTRIILLFITALLCTNVSQAQKYFKPVNGGLENIETGKDYYLVNIPNKDSLQIYNALLSMVKSKFTGSEDKILETREGEYIKAYSYSRRGICTFYDLKADIEFKIKNNRYVFSFSKINMENRETKSGKTKRLLIKYGRSNLLRDDQSTEYLLNKKGKATLGNKDCYKSLIKSLDYLGKIFDISDEFEKYEKMKKEEDTGW